MVAGGGVMKIIAITEYIIDDMGEQYREDDSVKIETAGGLVLIGDITDIDSARVELRVDCKDTSGEVEIAVCDIVKIERW
jgi:hypothetical protein